jgi:Asp-tRNA(Asn)/Glu-tRNA(Gln) amidotransferase A subunit family amidase
LDELPPFHGIPFSVKDLISQKGFLNTIGMAMLSLKSVDDDAVVVTLMKKAGGIPMVRGNVPQTAISLHTHNLTFGESLNPHDLNRSPGGSSGGDAGLVAAKCTVVGLGSDIGGSLRFPAHFCGIYGFKPSKGRVSRLGTTPARKERFSDWSHLTGDLGPMGGSTDDLITTMEVLCDKDVHKLDPEVVPYGWHFDKAL